MCGIAGIVTWDERHRVTRETLSRMSARIAHRGPDGEGLLLTREHEPITPDTPQIAFAFRRLAVLDPDPRAMQPFTIGQHTVVFNGEIYNFRELRDELSKLRPEYAWRTTGDTEVLLLSYVVWGEQCVERLNGMFALAVWDERERTLFLARDRMGQKPLYHTISRHAGTIAFASELHVLRGLAGFVAEVDRESIGDYLRYGYTGERTIYGGGARSLLMSTHLTVRAGGGIQKQYFRQNETVARGRTAEDARTLIETAVQRQLVSDVPLGVFLSGGIDSSIIAACARKVGPVETFSIGFDDPRYDESRYAAEVAKHLGTRHHEFRVRPDAAADLPKLAAVFGEPFADSSALPTHYLARETRQHVKVALSGDGGDELFGGYERYRAMAIGQKLQGLPASVRSFIRSGASKLPGTHPKSVPTRLKRLIGTLDDPPALRYARFMRLFDDAMIAELLGASPETDDSVRDLYESFLDNRDIVEAALATDRVTYLPDDLLTKVDRASMLHALEVRSPFMDHELVQFAAGLSTDQLIGGGAKRMLREAFAADLPESVFRRKKMGFAVPIGEWFRTDVPLRAMLHDHLFAADSFAAGNFNLAVVRRLIEEHDSQRVDHSQRLYALLMLELWWRTQKA